MRKTEVGGKDKSGVKACIRQNVSDHVGKDAATCQPFSCHSMWAPAADARAEVGEAGGGMERRMSQIGFIACAGEQRRLQTIPTATGVERKEQSVQGMPTHHGNSAVFKQEHVGMQVKLREGYANFYDACDGPLKPGISRQRTCIYQHPHIYASIQKDR